MDYETPQHLQKFKNITALHRREDITDCIAYDTYGCESMEDVHELQEKVGGEWSIFNHIKS